MHSSIASLSWETMRERSFTEESLAELLAFLAVLHPRLGRGSFWLDTPESVLREIAALVLQPLRHEFVRWDPMAVVRDRRRQLVFGLTDPQPNPGTRFNSPEGIAVCGEAMHRASGIYTVELQASGLFSQDGFARADVGVVLDVAEEQRLGSGIWWEAGDGDVFVAAVAGGVHGSGEDGWVCDDHAVETGVLPKWDEDESVIGLVMDTQRSRLGFRQGGTLLPFEVPVPRVATPLHFAVGWDVDTAGAIRLLSFRRFIQEASAPPLVQLLAELRECAAVGSAAAAAATMRFCEALAGTPPSSEAVAAALGLMELDHAPERCAAIAAVFAEVCGGFSAAFVAAVLDLLKLYSVRERVARDLAAHRARDEDQEVFESMLRAQLPGLALDRWEEMARAMTARQHGRHWRWLRLLGGCCSLGFILIVLGAAASRFHDMAPAPPLLVGFASR